MRSIINVAQPQCGKTTYTLRETETCIEMVNLNMVFEYNITVEDVVEKAKAFSFSCERIDRHNLAKYRSELVQHLDCDFPTMLVGIMDVYRGAYVEGFLIWCKQRGIPVRMIVDEYDVFAIGHTNRENVAARDEWLKMIMDRELVDIIEFNSATNINGVISDFDWAEVNVVKPFDGYVGWDSVQCQTLDDSHFQALLNGEMTAEMRRKLARAYESQENVLMNLDSRTEAHNAIHRAVEGQYQNIKRINYATTDSIADVPESNTLIIGGNKFSRSVSVPNLSTLFYYRNSLPVIANLLQSCGRVLGRRSMDPTIVTTPTLAKSLEQGWQLEQRIITEEILSLPYRERFRWLKSAAQNLDSVRLFSGKANGHLETRTPFYQETDDVTGFIKFDHWYEIDMPDTLWEQWETKAYNRQTGPQMWELCVSQHPYLATIQGVRDEADGANAANRVRLAIREHLDNGYNRFVNSKNSKRKYPIMYGRQRFRPGKGFLIVREPDVTTHTSQCYHHNEYGRKMRQFEKGITRADYDWTEEE